MRNITITVDEEVARWARVYAARHESSVSRVVGELLRRYMQDEAAADAALADYQSRPLMCFDAEARYPTRDDLHDR